MPTYGYKREDGTTFEVMQRITDEPLEECPTTGQKVKRMISGGAGLIFKGNGFYLTDYVRNKTPGGDGNSGGKEDSKPSSSESAKSESKSTSSTSSTTSTPKKD